MRRGAAIRRGATLGGVALLAWIGQMAPAGATPIPRLHHDHGVLVTDRPAAQLPHHHLHGAQWGLDPIAGTDILARHISLSVDPATGLTSASMQVTLRAEQSGVDRLYLWIDPGLGVSSATANGAPVEVNETTYAQIRLVQVSLGGPLAAGEEVVLAVDYGGTLGCPELDGGSYCDLELPMAVLMEGSALPLVIDSSNLGGYNVWGSSRSLELTLPSGTDVVAPGDLTLDQDDGDVHVTRWEMDGYHSAGAYLAVLGDLASGSLAGTTPKATIVRAANEPSWELEMKGWMGDILAFVDAQAGAPLPFAELSIVKLAGSEPLPGTAGHGMVLLADTYGGWGDAYFEETLAHETSHEWWGVLVAPTDFNRSRWLVEGLATLSQIDYAAAKLAGGLERDAYLARRYNEHAVLLRYLASAGLPAVVPPLYPQLDQAQDTLWAYIRSSAALEYLRVQAGDDAFAAGLRRFRAECAGALCDSDDFQAILEAESGRDLGPAFAAAVYQQSFPAAALEWSQAGSDGPISIRAISTTAAGAAIDLPLEVIITLAGGAQRRERVVLPEGGAASVDVGAGVIAVRPEPRQDAVIWTHSAQAGDVDFDMGVDGIDVIHCAYRHGRDVGVAKPDGEGLNRLDLDFDPRCDGDGDGAIGDADINPILASFGTIREAK